MTADDLFEQRLERQLRDYAVRGAGDPDASAIARAIAIAPSSTRVGTVATLDGGRDGGVAGRCVVAPSPSGRLLLVLAAALTIGLVSTAFLAGGLSHRNVVAPTSTASVPASEGRPTPRLFAGVPTTPRNDLCPGATRLADIWDTSVAANAMNHWISSDLHPLEALGSRAVADIVPVPGGPTEVRILDPLTSRSCLLLELPEGVVVDDAEWSPSDDVFAISVAGAGTTGVDPVLSDGSLYIWSAMGTTRPMAPEGDKLSWSPDGSNLAISAAFGMWTLAGNGAPPLRLNCEHPANDVNCPAFPALLWSPNSDRLVMQGGDRRDSTKYGPASMLDPVFHLITPVPALEGAAPIGWLDSQTLLEASDSSLFEVPVDDRTHFRQHDVPNWWSADPVFSPDQRMAASGSFRNPVRIMDLGTGRETVVIGATELGSDLDYNLEWSSDSRSLVVSVDHVADGTSTQVGLWVVNADGSGLRKLISGQVALAGTEETQAARAALRSYWARALNGPAESPGPS